MGTYAEQQQSFKDLVFVLVAGGCFGLLGPCFSNFAALSAPLSHSGFCLTVNVRSCFRPADYAHNIQYLVLHGAHHGYRHCGEKRYPASRCRPEIPWIGFRSRRSNDPGRAEKAAANCDDCTGDSGWHVATSFCVGRRFPNAATIGYRSHRRNIDFDDLVSGNNARRVLPTRRTKANMKISLFVYLLLTSAFVTAQAFPDAPSAVMALESQTVPNEPPAQTCCSTNSSDSGTNKSSLSSAVKRGIKDQVDIYTAPFHKSALKWDIGVSAVTAGLMVVDPDASRKFSDTPRTPSLRISDVGLWGTVGSVGMFYLSGSITDNPHAKETGFLGAEALANTAITYTLFKTATGRERPLVGAGNGRFWHYNRLGSSFPSGHASLTWAGAAVIAHEYPKRWVQLLTYGTATAVSFTRYSGRAHFPSDLLVGSTVGYLIGTHIFKTHCRLDLSVDCKADY